LAVQRATQRAEPMGLPPLHVDPFILFGGHAARVHSGDMVLVPGRSDQAYIDAVTGQHMNIYGRDFIAPNKVTARILDMFRQAPKMTLDQVRTALPQVPDSEISRSVGWLLKMGLLGTGE